VSSVARRDAPAIDGFALDEIHQQIRRAVGGFATIDQPRDARMIQCRKDLAFGQETPREFTTLGARCGHQLDGDALAESAIAAFAQPDCSHSARADRRDQFERTQPLSRVQRALPLVPVGPDRFDRRLAGFARIGGQPCLDLRANRVIDRLIRSPQRRTRLWRHVGQGIEQGTGAGKPLGIQGHGPA